MRPSAPASSPPESGSNAETRIQVEVNGAPQTLLERTNLSSLLKVLELAGKRVAVAVNRVVIARSRYAEIELAEGDRIEILEAVGGG